MRQIKVEKNVGGVKGLCVVTPAVHGYSRGCKKAIPNSTRGCTRFSGAEGYSLEDGVKLDLSDKDQK